MIEGALIADDKTNHKEVIVKDEIPTISSLSYRIEHLEHQSGTLLLLSATNLFMNVATIAIGFLIAL